MNLSKLYFLKVLIKSLSKKSMKRKTNRQFLPVSLGRHQIISFELISFLIMIENKTKSGSGRHSAKTLLRLKC